MTTDTDPRPDGRHTHRSDRGYSSVTRYWDDGSEASVMFEDRAGLGITYRPARSAEGRLRPERTILWEDHTPTREWVLRHREGDMPDHIFEFIHDEAPGLDLKAGGAP